MKQSIFYILPALHLVSNVCGAYFPVSQSLDADEAPIRVLPRSLSSRSIFARSPLPQQKDQSTKTTDTTKSGSTSTRNVEQVTPKSSPSDNVVQEAAKALALATKSVDDIVMIIQNPKSSEATIKKAAQDALKNESDEDFPRQALASAAENPTDAQGSLAIIRDQGPIVVGGFKEIEKNSQDRKKVVESLKEIILARLQVVAANNALIGGTKGGDRKLIATSQVSPSQEAVGRQLDTKQKQTVEEAQKNLTSQTKKVDEAVAIIQKSGSTPQQIEAAAKAALVQEAEEDFARQVLASAARDPKAAMEALAGVRDHGPNEVIAGFKAIEANPKDAASVKKNIDLVVKGRQFVVPANLKLIELAGGSGGSSTSTLQQATNSTGGSSSNSTSTSNSKTGSTTSSTIGTTTTSTTDNTKSKDGSDPKKNTSSNTSSDPQKLLDLSGQKNSTSTNEITGRDPRGLLASLAGDDGSEPSVVLFGSAAKSKNN